METLKKTKGISFLKFVMQSASITKDPIKYHRLFFEKYGDTFTILNFKNPVILSRDVAVARHILKFNHRNFHKSPYQSTQLAQYIGYGLLTSNGNYWLKQRRMIQPAFHKERLEKLLAIINKTVQEHIDILPVNKTIDVLEYMTSLAFDVVANSLFQFSAEKGVMKRLQIIIAELQVFIVEDIRQPHKRLWFQLNGSKKHHMNLVEESRAIIQTLIDARRNATTTHNDLLQMLLEARYEDGTAMSDDVLIDEIIVLFVAGHETTANALTFALYLLSKAPEELHKIRKEVLSNENYSNDLMTQLGLFEQTKSVIEETMRLYPPAWITDRVALADDQVGSFAFKKGTTIGVSFYEIHRNPEFWKAPNDFMPSRFLEGDRKEIAANYFPFGAGPRFCIGNNFAMYEMILAVAGIASKFTIESNAETVVLKPLITLKPEGVLLKFIRR